MTIESCKPTTRGSWRGMTVAAVASALLVTTLSIGAVGSAQAETTTFNPFEVNRGFTIVSRSDAHLSNAELEGSVAAFGSISSGNQNGYPIIHQAAGIANYTVPQIDDVPVRILANNFVGSGSFELSNRDDSGTIAADSAEATATAKLVDVSNVTGEARGGGKGPAAGKDFLRVKNTQQGILDLTTTAFEGSSVTQLATLQSSVSNYFATSESEVARANQCLASMYASTDGSVQNATLTAEGGLLYLEDLSTTKPNIVDYAAINGSVIKLDRADGYVPTAAAPLVVKVPAGTTTLAGVKFEGWSSHANDQQDFARYILFDLSLVGGSVTVNGVEMGALWAPNVDLSFASDITTNGQWFAKSLTTSGAGEIHHHAFSGQLPCGATSTPDPTTTNPTSVSPTTNQPTTVTPTSVDSTTPTEAPSSIGPTSIEPTPTTATPTQTPSGSALKPSSLDPSANSASASGSTGIVPAQGDGDDPDGLAATGAAGSSPGIVLGAFAMLAGVTLTMLWRRNMVRTRH